ncbi:MFS domain-containing protein [Heracleum sosnowskyi]|uniref:MFS domain-containing protein n=1 Tax=Heracleum sosnowskyi TaxID=360622 RepID=A0AAD8NC93_9APIA|nr:MFS domain-containing protein [Heracleum sosnowskyi]
MLTSITTFLTSLSPNIWVYALLRFASGFVRCGIGIGSLVLATEAVRRKWRGQVGQYGFFQFTNGFLTLISIVYPYRTNWRKIYQVISIFPLVYSVLVIPFISESPRWLAVKGRKKEALDVLRRYARLNGKELPQNINLSEPSSGHNKISLWSTKWAAARMILQEWATARMKQDTNS